MNSSKKITEQTPPPAYFGSLTIKDVKCFKGEQTIDLLDGNGKPAMWTVILGNNNTGKTTLLRCLANLEPTEIMKLDKFEKRPGNTPSKHDLIPKVSKIGMFSNDKHYTVKSSIFLKYGSKYKKNETEWAYSQENSDRWFSGEEKERFGGLVIYGYGTARKMGKENFLVWGEDQDNTASLFDSNSTLVNIEEWLLQLDYVRQRNTDFSESTDKIIEKIASICTSGLLPGVQDLVFVSELKRNNIANNYVAVKVDNYNIPLRDLGDGYQITLTWVADLAKKMFERYPESENPLHEPAIVLVDEIDLHLHPEWQRKIISFLKTQFPHTQFIVTTHSPLIVQSAEDINLVLLKKEENHVIIEQPKVKTYRGWTVEEILSELMGLDDKTLSDDYLKLMQQFDEALDEDDYKKAKNAYDELDKMLHPTSHQRKLLRIQMSSLMPE